MLHRRDLVDLFLAFARELQNHRAAIRAGRPAKVAPKPEGENGEPAESLPAFLTEAPPPLMVGAGEAAPAPALSLEPDAEIVLRRLQDFLEAQTAQVGRIATDLLMSQYREAQYAMVALADDLFIHEIEWNGREIWRSGPLEQALYRTRLAGERVFDRMEALLASNDRRLVQLAAVYLCILGLGFKGRYRVPGGDLALRSFSSRLYEFIDGRESELAEGMLPVGRTLMPPAYAHTIADGKAKTLARGPRWALMLAAVLGVWLVLGQAAWWLSTAPLAGAAERALQASVHVAR